MTARETETALLTRCAQAAAGGLACAKDESEANVFRVASRVLGSEFSQESARLMQVSDAYFAQNTEARRLPSADVVRLGWVPGLPWLRENLRRKIKADRS